MSEITARLTAALADRYAVERELGSGGMATVYLAEDLKHHRKVAVKVLRPELAAVIGGERFLKEIEVTAHLQHPHILPLFDSGEADAFLYYVMPHVAGESLREKLDREKQLSIEESIDITEGVASALDYAHRHDVVHRDIKPENILLHDGQPVVADFGIALAISAAGGTRLTETGLSVGTPHYMSPEQASADRELDGRTDVYSLGATLYEMLAGDPPFTAASAQAIVAKILTEEPAPVTAERRSVPPHVGAAIHTALAKLPADRFGSASEFAEALTNRAYAPPVTRAMPTASLWKRMLGPEAIPWSLVAVAIVVIAVLVGQLVGRPDTSPGPVVRATIELPREAELLRPTLAMSRDGSLLIVRATVRGRAVLLQHRMDEEGLTAVPGTDDGSNQFLSPDARWLGFRASDMMKKVSLEGGPAVLMDDQGAWAGGSWDDDGTIIYSRSYLSGLWRIAADGGAPEVVTTPDNARRELAHWWPQRLPDGDHVIFTAFSTPVDSARIEVLSLATGERSVLVQGGVFGRYVSSGHVLYARNETVFAVPFDVRRRMVTGQAVPVLDDVYMDHVNGVAAYAVSEDGTLAYVRASIYNTAGHLVWVDRRGDEEPVLATPDRYEEPAISPDGDRIAMTLTKPGETPDVWVLGLGRNTMTRLTLGGGADFASRWTPSGDRVIYASERPAFDLYWRSADGGAPAEVLVESPFDKRAYSFAPDGSLMLFTSDRSPSALWSVGLDGGTEPTSLLESDSDLGSPELSPDGRWLAFVSNQSGRWEVYLVPFPEVTGRRRQVSSDGGSDPRWTRAGRELVFRSGDRVMVVDFDPATGGLGTPTVLFVGPYLYSSREGFRNYDVAPDGERFLMVRQPAGSEPREIVVVANWFEELKAKVGN